MLPRRKEIIIQPLVPPDRLTGFISQVAQLGVHTFLLKSPVPGNLSKEATIISPSSEGDVILVSSNKDLEVTHDRSRPKALYFTIKSRTDVENAVKCARQGVQYLLIEAENWKIIPLENLIAELHKTETRTYALVDSPEEIETLFGVLEMGVDGIILPAKTVDDVKRVLTIAPTIAGIGLDSAEVIEVRDVGMGERVCIDTASILKLGEGVLVGSRVNFLFLVHNESVGSQFTSPRPFRVNAGGIHSYTLLPNGMTKYLSELEGGDKILVVNDKGEARVGVIGRVKIERRPLRLIKAEYGGEVGSILVQNAETIGFMAPNDKILLVTEMKIGDRILASVKPAKGRHFGTEVDEFILEK